MIPLFINWKIMEVGRAPVTGMVHRHYLHQWPGVVVCTLALLDKLVIGCIVFALRHAKHEAVRVRWRGNWPGFSLRTIPPRTLRHGLSQGQSDGCKRTVLT